MIMDAMHGDHKHGWTDTATIKNSPEVYPEFSSRSYFTMVLFQAATKRLFLRDLNTATYVHLLLFKTEPINLITEPSTNMCCLGTNSKQTVEGVQNHAQIPSLNSL